MAITVDSSPTKEFFVEMLTRDIDLTDAILDLLDNCLDGVLRKRGSMDIKRDDFDYSGFEANITIEKDCFIIQDNCGGISKSIAINSAFRMGRDSTNIKEPFGRLCTHFDYTTATREKTVPYSAFVLFKKGIFEYS